MFNRVKYIKNTEGDVPGNLNKFFCFLVPVFVPLALLIVLRHLTHSCKEFSSAFTAMTETRAVIRKHICWKLLSKGKCNKHFSLMNKIKIVYVLNGLNFDEPLL